MVFKYISWVSECFPCSEVCLGSHECLRVRSNAAKCILSPYKKRPGFQLYSRSPSVSRAFLCFPGDQEMALRSSDIPCAFGFVQGFPVHSGFFSVTRVLGCVPFSVSQALECVLGPQICPRRVLDSLQVMGLQVCPKPSGMYTNPSDSSDVFFGTSEFFLSPPRAPKCLWLS